MEKQFKGFEDLSQQELILINGGEIACVKINGEW